MARLAIIPARGGSKRIPKKNIRNFLGKPIISYSIEVAINSGLFDEVMVSSDSEEIATVAKQYGAKVPFIRSEQTSGDFAGSGEVIQEVLGLYEGTGLHFDYVCCIYPCAPFITVDRLVEAHEMMIKNNFSTVFPVLPFGFPIQRALHINNDLVSFVSPEYALERSQDLAPRYHDAGQFYWLRSSDFLSSGKIIGERAGGIIISELEAQDIDNEVDWKMAELKFTLR
jgi:pseudaminic acid cytidylyltransferase